MSDHDIQFNTQEMLEAMALRPRPNTFLSSQLVKSRTPSDQTHFQLDRDFGGQSIAAYVNRVGDPNEVGKGTFESALYVAPYVSERITITPADAKVRLPGMSQYSGNARSILDQRQARWLADLQDRFIRLEEKQVAEILQTGKLVVSGKDVSYTIDYGVDATHMLDVSGTAPWSGAADKLANLQAWCQQIADNGGAPPTVAYLGSDVAAALLKDTDVRALLDNRSINIGEVNPVQLSGQRATYIGRLSGVGFSLALYTYFGGYRTPNGSGGTVFNRYMNSKKLVLTSTELSLEYKYGMIENLNGNFIGMRLPNYYAEDARGKKAFLEMESSPLPILRDPVSLMCVKVLV